MDKSLATIVENVPLDQNTSDSSPRFEYSYAYGGVSCNVTFRGLQASNGEFLVGSNRYDIAKEGAAQQWLRKYTPQGYLTAIETIQRMAQPHLSK